MFDAHVLVAHSSPVISAGLATVLRRLEGCEVRVLDTEDEPCAATGHVVVLDDLALAARFSTCAGAAGEPIRGAIPKVALLTNRAEQVDPSSMGFNGVSAWLSIDCREEELLGTVRALLEDAPSGRWSPAIRSDDTARRLPNSAVSGRRMRLTGGLAPGALRRVREDIDANFARKIDLSRLAGIAGLSTSHFSRAFKQTVGMPPYRYVRMRRVAAAAELIRKTGKTLAEVATEIGFSDQSHLTRIFVQMTGETPGALQRRYR
jgi:AraC-like DNA-binding protein